MVFLIVLAKYFTLWLRAMLSNARVPLFELIVMSLRRVNPSMIVDARIMLAAAQLDVATTEMLVAHHLAGGDVRKLVLALIAASGAGIDLSFERAAAIDLAGDDVHGLVLRTIKPSEEDLAELPEGGTLIDALIADLEGSADGAYDDELKEQEA